MFADVSADDVRRAAEVLRAVVRRTLVRRARRLSAEAGLDVWLKLENEQLTGSFKLRGAYHALASLSPNERARGVVAASAGNHGRGIAYAARHLGIPATIYAPSTAPRVKLDGMRECGATVDTSAAHYDEAHALALAHARREDLPYIDPCSGAALVAGQGTVAMEIFEDVPPVRTLVVPVGGGGLIGGIGAYVRVTSPRVRIVGVQSEHTDTMARSLAADRVVDASIRPTLADGLAGAIDAHGLDVGRRAIDDMITVPERAIARAIAFLANEEGVIAEGSAAVGVAALLTRSVQDIREPVVVVISGGNIDRETLDGILSQ